MKIKALLLLILIVCFPSIGQADHSHKRFELGVGVGPSYVLGDGVYGNIHAHAIWNIVDSPVGLGLGYERLTRGEHNTISFVSRAHIYYGWSASIATGLTFGDEISGALHLETLYEVEINDYVHAGPALEVGMDKHEVHITPRIHVGFVF